MKLDHPLASSILLMTEHNRYYLELSDTQINVHLEDRFEPLFKLDHPISIAHVVADQLLHLVYLSSDGELAYSMINQSGSVQTVSLSKIDPQTYRIKKLMIIPADSSVHLFYAYSTKMTPELWRIEHRFWNGYAWKSTRLGEIVNPTGIPLFTATIDSKRNLHLLMATFKGNSTLIISNRFNGGFHIWSKPIQEFSVPGEITEIASYLSTNDTHYLFWVNKLTGDQTKLGWAIRNRSQILTSRFELQSPLPYVPHLNHGIKKIGVARVQDDLFLWVHSDLEYLLAFDGKEWSPFNSEPYSQDMVELITYKEGNLNQTYWSEQSKGRLSFLDELQLEPFHFGIQEKPVITDHEALQKIENEPQGEPLKTLQDRQEIEETEEIKEIKEIEEIEETQVINADKNLQEDHELPEKKDLLDKSLKDLLRAISETLSDLTANHQALKTDLISHHQDLKVDLGNLTHDLEKLKLSVESNQTKKGGFWSRWFS